jgi:hypothetical protein
VQCRPFHGAGFDFEIALEGSGFAHDWRYKDEEGKMQRIIKSTDSDFFQTSIDNDIRMLERKSCFLDGQLNFLL